MTQETKTYILEMKDNGQQRVTVPATWKLTFGPICPGSRDGAYNSGGGIALRFYENNKDNQRAVFTGVVSFRDSSIRIEEKVVEVKQQRMRKATPQGEKDFVVEANVSYWRNPDDPQTPDPEFTALPRTILD